MQMLPHHDGDLQEAYAWGGRDISTIRRDRYRITREPPPAKRNASQAAYGSSETFTSATALPSDAPAEDLDTHGALIAGSSIRIIDGVSGDALGPGEEGEITLKGLTLMRGYVKVPPEEAFDSEGYFHTGDAGWVDDRGLLHWTGRLTTVIKTSGANVSPLEVEELLATHPDVKGVAVVGVPDPSAGELVIACVVPRADGTLTEDAVREFLRGRCRPTRFRGGCCSSPTTSCRRPGATSSTSTRCARSPPTRCRPRRRSARLLAIEQDRRAVGADGAGSTFCSGSSSLPRIWTVLKCSVIISLDAGFVARLDQLHHAGLPLDPRDPLVVVDERAALSVLRHPLPHADLPDPTDGASGERQRLQTAAADQLFVERGHRLGERQLVGVDEALCRLVQLPQGADDGALPIGAACAEHRGVPLQDRQRLGDVGDVGVAGAQHERHRVRRRLVRRTVDDRPADAAAWTVISPSDSSIRSASRIDGPLMPNSSRRRSSGGRRSPSASSPVTISSRMRSATTSAAALELDPAVGERHRAGGGHGTIGPEILNII